MLIPAALQDAMSMQAQAERERQARVILGDSERQVAEKFGEAAKTYADNPTALHLRAMNMLYEGLKRARDHRHRALDRRRVDAARRADPGDGRQRRCACEGGGGGVAGPFNGRSIMISALRDQKRVIRWLVDQTVFLRQPP